MRFVIAVMLSLLAFAAYAQQQQTPSQVAVQIQSIIGSWAQALESMQQQNAQLQARIKELEAKEKSSAK